MRSDAARLPAGERAPAELPAARETSDDRRRLLAACGAGVVLALLLLFPLLLTGVPAYMHDWTWPPDPAGLRAQLLQGWEPWLDDGLGHPNPYPIALPHFVVLGLLAGFVPSRLLLAILLVTTFTTAFVTATAFARRVFGLGAWALACGALYVAAPLVLTKLIAGHLSYLQAYAVFPLFALALREAPHSRRWTAAGVLAVGISALQPQFLGYEAVYALIAALTGAVAPVALRNVGLLSIPLLLPTLVGPTLNAHGAEGILLHQHAIVDWEKEQSAPLLDALYGLGYFTRYVDRLAVPYTLYALGLVPAAGLFAAVVWLRDSRSARALVVCAAVGWLLVVGLNGPLAPLAAWAFEHVAPLSVFRELFNAMVLFWFPACVLAAVALARLPRPASVAIVVVVAGVLAVPWARYAGYFVQAPDAAALRAASGIAAADAAAAGEPPAAGRVVWWPALQPLGPANRAQGGSDPLARSPLDGFGPLYEYQPEGHYGTAVALGRAGRWDEAARILGGLGVRYVVDRVGIVSFASGVPARTPSPGGALLKDVGHAGGLTVYRVAETRPLVTAEPDVPGADPVIVPYAPSLVDATPRAGRVVAAFPYVWKSPGVADCGNLAVVSDGATLAARGGPWILAAPFEGGMRCRWRPASSLRSATGLYVAAGWAAAPRQRAALPTAPVAVPQAIAARPGHWYVRLTSPRAALLVVRTSFDGRWRARIDGRDAGAPARWNGFPAWPLAAGTHAIDVGYAGGTPVRIALAIALAGLILAAALAALPDNLVIPYRFRRSR